MSTSESTTSRSILAPAVDALARELPVGRRKLELTSLARTLELQASDSNPPNELDRSPLSDWLEHVSRKSKLRTHESRAWLYPCLLTFLMCIILLFLSPLILQPFADMFDEFGLSLPTITSFVLYVGTDLFGTPIRAISLAMLICVGGYAVYWLLSHVSPFSKIFYRIVAGNSSSVAAMAHIAGTLAHHLRSGISLPDALIRSAESCGHHHLAQAARSLAEQLRSDPGPLRMTPAASAFPQNLLDAIKPIDGSVPNTALLNELSLIYEERYGLREDFAGGAIGIVGVLAVGALVMFIVLALFAPLIELVSGLT